jgi:NADH dehydrogenase FAD-containing subunit
MFAIFCIYFVSFTLVLDQRVPEPIAGYSPLVMNSGNELRPHFLKRNWHGQVEGLPTLQVPGHPQVYTVGDQVEGQQGGRPLPIAAQVGIQTGITAGQNILRELAGYRSSGRSGSGPCPPRW